MCMVHKPDLAPQWWAWAQAIVGLLLLLVFGVLVAKLALPLWLHCTVAGVVAMVCGMKVAINLHKRRTGERFSVNPAVEFYSEKIVTWTVVVVGMSGSLLFRQDGSFPFAAFGVLIAMATPLAVWAWWRR
jgi:hypothetical protein